MTVRKKRSKGGGPFEVAISGVVGVLIGAALAVMFSRGTQTPRLTPGPSRPHTDGRVDPRPTAIDAKTTSHSEIAPTRPAGAPAAVPIIGADPIPDLRSRHLLIPVEGVNAADLIRSFADRRGTSREHEALDIPAPRGTKVFAVEDGSIEKLFYSKQGGTTIYQFDPTRTYAYYYAHLQEYARGLAEHAPVRRGQLLGYVGTSGNAPPNAPHLHFAVFLLTDKKQWWQGTALDPYDVLR
jgi:murein DD-endopeptidase MepM/ murein hydrolase activator NlpD